MTKIFLLYSWAVLIPLTIMGWRWLLRRIGHAGGIEYVALAVMLLAAVLAPFPLQLVYEVFMELPLK